MDATAQRIAVIGGGYVGLVTGAGLASLGHTVVVGERDPARVERLRSGRSPIYEEGLDDLLGAGIDSGRLSFTVDNAAAVDDAAFVFIALPTPSDPHGAADLSFIEDVLAELGDRLAGKILVTKSTVPVGTNARFQAWLDAEGLDAEMVSNPEFLQEGVAVPTFMAPDRIVVGARSGDAGARVAALFGGLGDVPVIHTDTTSAEMIKYAANVYLATRITMANSFANLAEEVGADIEAVTAGIGSDRRIGPHFLRAGPGFGGSCFPKDTRALLATARDVGYGFPLLEQVLSTNAYQATRVVDRVARDVGRLVGRRVAVWGAAFKAGTDDVRESPAVRIMSELVQRGAHVVAYDPEAPIPAGVEVADSAIDAVAGADALVVATEWPEFADVDLTAVAASMEGTLVLDARNVLDADRATAAGLAYRGIGRLA